MVVRPDDKVREGVERRLGDAKRGRSYVSLLTEAERKRFLPPGGTSLSALLSPLSPTTTRLPSAPAAPPSSNNRLPAPNAAGQGLAPLERTATAPEASERTGAGSGGGGGRGRPSFSDDEDASDDDDARRSAQASMAASTASESKKSSSSGGGGIRAALGFGKKKKDKGKEFKKFGTFS